jgi:glucose-1-phosphate cytidylyltransferase
MKVIILAGGLGTRLAEETETKPKPMVEIGGRPILWHIMKLYSRHGFNDFAVALGYKGEVIKKYFVDYLSIHADLTVNFRTGQVIMNDSVRPNWKIDLVDTGANTMTGGRVKRLRNHVENSTFMMTYGDGVSDVDLTTLLAFHRSHGKLATLTAVRPVARFGQLEIGDSGRITDFEEKPQTKEGWINGGFFVLEPGVFDYIDGDDSFFERDPLERLSKDGQLMAYMHDSFWQCMDTLRDKERLEKLWQSGQAPWKTWQE